MAIWAPVTPIGPLSEGPPHALLQAPFLREEEEEERKGRAGKEEKDQVRPLAGFWMDRGKEKVNEGEEKEATEEGGRTSPL